MEDTDGKLADVVGYMLKVMKNKINHERYKKEFNCIRHGNFIEFIRLVNCGIPPMAFYTDNKLKSNLEPSGTDKLIEFIKFIEPHLPQQSGTLSVSNMKIKDVEDMCSFGQMIACESALDKFESLIRTYCPIANDLDFHDDIFKKLAMFEIVIRIQLDKHNQLTDRIKLVDAIDKLKEIFPLTKDEISKLHDGRKFLNSIKHSNDISWKNNLSLFEEAYFILEKHNIQIF